MSTNINKYRLKYRYYKLDLEDVVEKQKQCVDIFNKAYGLIEKNIDKTENEKTEISIDQRAPEEDVDAGEVVSQNIDSENDKKCKNLFKKIALHTHPDRVTSLPDNEIQHRTDLYKKANGHKNNGQYEYLLDIALELKIESFASDEEELDFLERKISNIKIEIKAIKDTAAWLWAHANKVQRKKIEENISIQFNICKI